MLVVFSLALAPGQAFVVPSTSKPTTSLGMSDSEDSILDKIQATFKIAQESNAAGSSFKQVLADVIAGDDFDRDAVSQTIEETINSAPCVMYTWENSPSCKQAIEAFQTIGTAPKIVRLDDPWDEGNPVRATLGRQVGRTSVPFVFIGGQYIGGYDGGLEGNPDAGGMVDLAFRGKLREMLTEAGALN